MNNKGALSTVIVAIVMVAFLLLALALYFIGPEALYVGLTQGIDKAVEKVFSAFKKEQFKGPTAEIDKNVEDSYNSIVSVLRSEGKGPCLLKRGDLASNFKDYRILLSKTEDGGIFVQLIDKKDVTLKRDTVFGKLPCVIGEGDAAKNFYDNYLANKVCEPNCKSDYTTANNIEFKNGDSIYVNGEKRSIKDGNLIFKTKDGNICFFQTYSGLTVNPIDWYTKWGCDAAQEGLDDDCINKIKERIPECKKEDDWPVILQEYEKNKCKVDKYTCKVENLPCQCFTSIQKENKLKPGVCSIQKPYCYDGVEGCSDKSPDISYYFFVCRETNKNFQLAQKCSVDSDTCKVKNAPCTCYITKPVAGQQSFPQLCLEGQYCYNEQKGCSTESSSLDCQKSNKN